MDATADEGIPGCAPGVFITVIGLFVSGLLVPVCVDLVAENVEKEFGENP